MFKQYYQKRIEGMDSDKRLALFEGGELSGRPSEAATQYGVDTYTPSFAWQHECNRLEKLPAEQLEAVHDMSQRLPVEYVMEKYQFSKAQIIRICRIWQARMKSAAKAFEELALFFKEYAPIDSPTGNVYMDARLYIHNAMATIKSATWQAGRYPNEFTSAELAQGNARSDYGWVYQTLRAMPRHLVGPAFGEAGNQFLAACEQTFAKRKQRQIKYLEDSKMHAETSKRRPYRRPRREYLPRPNVDPETLAKLFADYTQLKTA
jgi:hypothetical protein